MTTTLLALLLITLMLRSGLVATTVGAPNDSVSALSPTIPTIPFSLGFGPSNLSPVSDGVPIYTVGDTIWASSGFNSSVSLWLTSPKASGAPFNVTTPEAIGPQIIAPLHSFASTDTDGVWNITIASQHGMYVIPVHFVNLADHPVSLGPLRYSFKGGNMSISTQANLGDSYHQEVCAAGNVSVSLSLPADMQDTGKIVLNPGSPFGIMTSGQVNESTSFWFELYYPYGVDVASANSVVVNDLMTASSQPVTLTTDTPSSTALAWSMPVREGQYDLMAFFQNSTSLDVVQSKILIINDSSWVSLSDSCKPMAVSSQNISYSANLAKGPDNWPRTFYLMYRTFGVESVVSSRVDANLSSVNFVASPWNESLQDVKVNVFPGGGVLQTSQDGNSLLVLASQYPAQLNYSLEISGGRDLAQGLLKINSSYETETRYLPMAKLIIHLPSGGSPATVDVTESPGVNVTSAPTEGNQSLSFILPDGAYTITVSQGSTSQSVQVHLTDGVATSVDFNLGTFPTLELILVVTAIIAGLGNVLVWLVRSRSLSSRLGASKQ